jgi:tripartite-type tricarboxylate transporter receptor subunit TctC
MMRPSGVIPGYEVVTWYGLLAPKGTPEPILAKLNKALNETIAEPAVRERLTKAGVIASSKTSPEGFSGHMAREFVRWSKIREAANLQQQ